MAKGNPNTSTAMERANNAPKAGGSTMNASGGKSHNFVKAETFEPRSAKGAKTGGKWMAETGELKVGDTVSLNSGSPLLTVTELLQGGELLAVTWHDGIVQKTTFPAACVKKADS